MGSWYGAKCEKCGYQYGAFLGVGFTFPKLYEETVKKMKSGKFGKQGYKFFKNHPDGAITCNNIVVQCDDCGKLMTVPELDLYVPKDGFDSTKIERIGVWSTAFSGKGYDYISRSDLHDHYKFYEHYDHRCSTCRGHASVVEGFTERYDADVDRHVRCPKCGAMMEIECVGDWD